jgi:hypothetical protein
MEEEGWLKWSKKQKGAMNLIKVHNMHVVNITMKLLHRIYAKNKEKSK